MKKPSRQIREEIAPCKISSGPLRRARPNGSAACPEAGSATWKSTRGTADRLRGGEGAISQGRCRAEIRARVGCARAAWRGSGRIFGGLTAWAGHRQRRIGEGHAREDSAWRPDREGRTALREARLLLGMLIDAAQRARASEAERERFAAIGTKAFSDEPE